ncbi:MBL fold metallo-hydrolase [Methylobacterium sp. A54F]
MIDANRRRFALAGLALPVMLRGAPARATSAPLPVSEPSHHRFALGHFTVTMLLDAAAMIDGPWPIVGEDRTPAEIAALMRENRLPPTRFRPGFTPVLVDTGRARVLFDTGNGAVGFVPRPAGGRLGERLRQAGIDPASIDLVVITHAHTDHIGGLMEDGRPAFAQAGVVIAGSEHAFWSDESRLAASPETNEHRSAQVFRSHLLPLRDRTRLISDGDEIVPGIRALAAPGHTPGHTAFHVESAGRRLLIWGDCAHHEVASLAHPEWHALFDMDKATGAATRRRIYELAATEDVLVAAYHTSFPSLGYVARRGTGYRWIPLTYQLDA